MALTGDTGNGATLSFAASMGFGTSNTTSMELISITPGAETVGSIDVSTLGTSDCMESIPSDLRDVGELSGTFKWLTSNAATQAGFPDLPAAAGTVTVTWPARSGTTAATYVGTGFITSWKPPSLQNGELQVGEFSVKFDGETGPTWTDEAA